MFRSITVLFVLLAILYFAFSRGIPSIEAFMPTEIGTLTSRADTYDGRRVTVKGTVLGSVAILGFGGYRLQEGEAEILVLSSHGIPETGRQVTVSGVFKQAFGINNLQYAVILEK